eukprot:CAMPEP_0183507174 /NCGR_PEP_ID=MMETSP0371-20130417/8023_1 /TAXON_ID=268820 /ORGANISM="Peridinium aciculiferum, Strain PAER-2" /LENGTH=71 /DNA_ID=CAMNT_0025703317 /DNA_START=183 /DNA_END=398 /DNA_ORIENTATION=+
MMANVANDGSRRNEEASGARNNGDDNGGPAGSIRGRLRFCWVDGLPHFRRGMRQLAAVLEAEAELGLLLRL